MVSSPQPIAGLLRGRNKSRRGAQEVNLTTRGKLTYFCNTVFIDPVRAVVLCASIGLEHSALTFPSRLRRTRLRRTSWSSLHSTYRSLPHWCRTNELLTSMPSEPGGMVIQVRPLLQGSPRSAMAELPLTLPPQRRASPTVAVWTIRSSTCVTYSSKRAHLIVSWVSARAPQLPPSSSACWSITTATPSSRPVQECLDQLASSTAEILHLRGWLLPSRPESEGGQRD